MTDRLKIALAQLNPTLGDMTGNTDLARKARAQAGHADADLIVFSELFITGYPPEDLVMKPAFCETARAAVEEFAKETSDGGPEVLIGTPWLDGERRYNAVAHLADGKVQTVRYKVDLPNYGVFDEKRVFEVGPLPGPINIKGVRIGVPICEDIWTEEVCECLEETGAEFFIVPNGSPFWMNKHDLRINVAVARITETGLPMVYVNQIGGQDELVFDGGSFVLSAQRELVAQMPAWEEGVLVTNWNRDVEGWVCEQQTLSPIEEDLEAVYLACVAGVRDYVNKNGFPGVVLGLSGGIDSALCAAIAVDALGADKVYCVMMPYKYTSDDSLEDAALCAKALGTPYDIIPISEPVKGFNAALSKTFKGQNQDVTEENIQSRARGTLLMALSNKFGTMVLTTGNKSELSVGYATLYGDMNGGFNPIKDVYKIDVFALATLRNAARPKGCLGPEQAPIPERIITKPPSAELREDQKDEDSLPPYDILDGILKGLVEGEQSVDELEAAGYDRQLIHRIENLLYIAEYKRRQSAPGIKITRKHFGRDRRYPITNKFRDKT